MSEDIYDEYPSLTLAKETLDQNIEPLAKNREYRVFTVNSAGIESPPAVLKWKNSNSK